ncbi:hypothetical protein KIW84_025284 [Lathyrus oleraceus]|uniref:Ubiquitin-like protease family profile domain-containing protein n=1 Tax=Pisum sativum TaxID=3888 RepID=A0A9D5B8T1_PEA|nr:hypothetical protein KIW84_025284 [Pisum sativum]
MFAVEYEFSTDELASLVRIPHGDGTICEAPLDSEWSVEVFSFWERLSNTSINSFEGVLASTIHNPTIRVFRYLLACTIFGRENPNKVNSRELLFLQGSLTNRRINSVPFMLAHMTLTLNKAGSISFGGLITSIARALNLNNEMATLDPLPPRTINLKFLRDMKLCHLRREEGYMLMVHGVAIPSVVLPCTRRTDVRDERNWTYALDAPPVLGPLPPNIPDEAGHDTDDEYDRRERSPVPHVSPHHPSPPHTAPSSSSAGTTPGFYITEEMWRDHMAREKRHTQARQQHHHRHHIALIENTQGSILDNLREVRTAQDALQARMDQRDRRRTQSRCPPQDGEGTSEIPLSLSLVRSSRCPGKTLLNEAQQLQQNEPQFAGKRRRISLLAASIEKQLMVTENNSNRVGLILSSTNSIRVFLSGASNDPTLSSQLRQTSSELLIQSEIPYEPLRAVWISSDPSTRPELIRLLSGTGFVFSSPKPREKSEELKARLKKLEDLAERKAYKELVKDIAPKEDVQEPFSSYKDQLGFDSCREYLVKRFMASSTNNLYLWPYNSGCHWLLLAIDPLKEVVYFLNSIDGEWTNYPDMKQLVDTSIKVFRSQRQARVPRTKSSNITWIKVQCPLQRNGIDCGYFVMRFMREIINMNQIEIPITYFDEYKCAHYTRLQLEQIKEELCQYFIEKRLISI